MKRILKQIPINLNSIPRKDPGEKQKFHMQQKAKNKINKSRERILSRKGYTTWIKNTIHQPYDFLFCYWHSQ